MRIVQSTVYLKELATLARRGSLVPAAFQRPYVWTRSDVLSLMASIQKGYPIGSFLLWTPYSRAPMAQVARPRLGPLPPSTTPTVDSILLDGQNRLASLAWAMQDLGAALPEDLTPHEREIWGNGDVLAVDLETEEFGFMPPEALADGLRIPAHSMLDYERANQTIREYWLGPWQSFGEPRITAAVKRFDNLQGAFMRAQTVVTDIQGASAKAAKDAFLHICKVGVPMRAEDFDAAVQWAQALKA